MFILCGVVCDGFIKLTLTSSTHQLKRFAVNDKRQSHLPDGFTFKDGSTVHYPGLRPNKPKIPIRVTTVSALKQFISEGYQVPHLDVRGNTSSADTMDKIHPVVKALYDRKRQNSIPGNRTDGRKIAIAIEGGGMRGCVAGGMVTALWYLGLQDSIDVVYGSSAGSLVGAYFIANQLPHYAPEVYYDVLTSAGREFIDLQAVLRACGLGVLDLRRESIASMFRDR